MVTVKLYFENVNIGTLLQKFGFFEFYLVPV